MNYLCIHEDKTWFYIDADNKQDITSLLLHYSEENYRIHLHDKLYRNANSGLTVCIYEV